MQYAEVARADSPRGEVVLRSREEPTGTVLELRVNGVFVMDTHETSTEEALAGRALQLVEDPRNVLVGGLGMGYTAHTLLGDVRVERVDVVELESVLVDWMRDGTIPHGPALLADQRIRVISADVTMAVAEAAARDEHPSYDLVLLDVDNGPDHLVHQSNATVYEADFLQQCREIMNPGGVLVVWSANPAPELATVLAGVFGDSEEQALPVHLQGREEQYYLYFARMPNSAR